VIKDFQILTRGVKHLQHAGIGEKIKERGEIQPGKRIDGGRHILCPGHLHETKLRPIGALPHEFGIDGDVAAPGDLATEVCERGGIGDQAHGQPLQANARSGKRAAGIEESAALGSGATRRREV
jgi:hypothetical protein